MAKFTFPVRAKKTLPVATKQGYSNFVCACLQAQSLTKLNQKLTKARREDARYGEFTHRKKTYVKTWPLVVLQKGFKVALEVTGINIHDGDIRQHSHVGTIK